MKYLFIAVVFFASGAGAQTVDAHDELTPTAPPVAAPAPPVAPAAPNLSARKTEPKERPWETPLPDDPWAGWPGKYSHYIGYEAGTSSIGVIGRNLVVYGDWTGNFATEYFLGFEKGGDTFAKTTSSTSSGTGPVTQSDSTTSTGAKNPYILTAGLGQKKKIYQGKWLQVYWGYFGGLTYTSSVSYDTGSTSQTTPDTTSPGTYSVTEAGLGTTKSATDLILFTGLKLGSEFYLRWFPNLALGFATGTMLTYGGKTTTTTTTESKTYSVVNGVPQTPTSVSSTETHTESDPGMRGTTFGIGGTSFQFTGLFTIRYVWK
ncbi:MAG: hypothetical protein ACXWQE_07555 [Bdellovibrionales bacterium]